MKHLRKISIKDIFGVFIFILLIIPAFIRKHILKKKLWLICEHLTARDNGYFFFKYMREKHPEIECYYAIDYNHSDYEKVRKLGNTVRWGSIKHYYYYMCSQWNLSSHKNGSPNHMLFTILRLKLNLYNNFVFLQHGIIYTDLPMFHKKNSKFKIFIAGASREAKFITKKFGYNNEVKYTGLARFDTLNNTKFDKDIILFMPTWRRWLTHKEDLLKSEYFIRINSLLSSKKLANLLEKNHKKLIFCAHNGLKDVCHIFKSNTNNIEVLDVNNANIQDLLIKGSILITDYSSIHFDFAYMKKPIIYYQYDQKEFLKKHFGGDYKNTYYKFEKDCFGPIVYDKNELIKTLTNIIKANNKLDQKYINKINDFFPLQDNKNCERIFNELRRG